MVHARERLARGLLTTALLAAVAVLAACGAPTAQPQPPAGSTTAPPGGTQGSTQAGGVTTPPAATPKRGGKLVVAVPTDPDGFDLHRTAAAASGEIGVNLFEGLVGVDARGEIVPALAERWQFTGDGKTYTFYLKRNALFHNGRPVTAEDVKFSLERILDPATKHPRASDYRAIERVEVVDALTVRLHLKFAHGGLLGNLAVGQAAVVPKEAVDQLKTKPIGTGPFRFVEWKPGQHVRLARFDRYHTGGLPYLDEVTFRVIPDANAGALALKSGEIDVIPRMAAEQIPDLKGHQDVKLLTGPQNLVQLMAINNARKPFDDPRVRQAISHAIDRAEIIAGAASGYGTPIGTHMTPATPGYVDLTGRYPTDPAKARALLAEAGYPNGFETTITLPEPYAVHRRAGEIIAEQLGRAGIRAKLQVIEWGKWLEDVYNGRKYDLTVIGHTGRLDPDALLNRYASSNKTNYMNYKNDEVDRLLEEGVRTTDEARRAEIYGRVQRLLTDQAASVYLMDPHQIVGLRTDVEGWEIFPIYVSDVTRVYRR